MRRAPIPARAISGALALAAGLWCGAGGAQAIDLTPIDNAATQKECSACHIAFPPQMLPMRSWQSLLGHLSSHFGEDASLPVVPFPDWETLPYDRFSPHPDIVSQRLAALHALPRLERGIVVVPVQTLLQRLPPLRYVAGGSFDLRNGQRLDLEALRGRLMSSSYAPREDHPRHAPMLAALERLFADTAVDGHVDFDYDTRVFAGVPD